MKKNAIVICARCSIDKKLFGIRVEKRKSDWHFTWSFPLNEGMADREGFSSNSVSGDNTVIDEEYHGCPYCGAENLVHCGVCGKLSCYKNNGNFKCAYCGNSGPVEDGWDGITLSGGGY